MKTNHYDVIIVGGGPAGLAAAIALADSGDTQVDREHDLRPRFRILIIERHDGPVDKACGEGIMPTGLACLEGLGVMDFSMGPETDFGPAAKSRATGFPFRGILYHSARGRTAAADFAEGPGRGLRRLELSRVLEFHARQRGVEIRRLRYRSFQYEGDTVIIRTDQENFSTRLLIGADGLHSRIRRQAGLAGPAAKLRRWGARRHFRVKPWSPYVEVHWRRGLEAYVTPVGPEEVGIALLWNAERLRPGGQDVHAALLKYFPELERRLNGATPLSTTRTAGPLKQKTNGTVTDGVLLLGDSAGYLDALTGEGLSLAFAEALALREGVTPLLARRGGRLAGEELGAFADTQRRITAPYYRTTGWVLLLHRLPFLQESAIFLLEKFPGLFQYFLSVNMGTKKLFAKSSHPAGPASKTRRFAAHPWKD